MSPATARYWVRAKVRFVVPVISLPGSAVSSRVGKKSKVRTWLPSSIHSYFTPDILIDRWVEKYFLKADLCF